MRILALVTDAFGGHGGIAKFNRDLLRALANNPEVERIVALPRIAQQPFHDALPPKLEFVLAAARGKACYVRGLVGRKKLKPDLIVCGHIHLLPLAFSYQLLSPAPILLIVHGIDAWQPTGRRLTDLLAKRVRHFLAVSPYTLDRFCAWTGQPASAGWILPNCVDLQLYCPGPKSALLLQRYGVEGQRIILTLGRLAAAERYKGFDEVLEVMPELLRHTPNLTHMIAGDGADQARLVAKARSLGLAVLDYATAPDRSTNTRERDGRPDCPPQVVFTGRVKEDEKVDHYRLADGYVMPSRGEGFGIVFLEALACGIPVIGSKLDGSADALKGGELGLLVDPCNRTELRRAIEQVLEGRGIQQTLGVRSYSFAAFEERLRAILVSVSEPSNTVGRVQRPLAPVS